MAPGAKVGGTGAKVGGTGAKVGGTRAKVGGTGERKWVAPGRKWVAPGAKVGGTGGKSGWHRGAKVGGTGVKRRFLTVSGSTQLPADLCTFGQLLFVFRAGSWGPVVGTVVGTVVGGRAATARLLQFDRRCLVLLSI